MRRPFAMEVAKRHQCTGYLFNQAYGVGAWFHRTSRISHLNATIGLSDRAFCVGYAL